ncbi:unnamed protein product [Blepharisma stoltei]|uniref:RING-type domain-containing protein n=1 Tax=Blepharisma stoltei TaxID=1481888 RepID=A0AAU9JVU8_9CILI|nr:unnamed protein product [Blepharisma stoltei]
MGNSSSENSQNSSFEDDRFTPETEFTPASFIPTSSGNWHTVGLAVTRRSNYVQQVGYMKCAKIKDPPTIKEIYFDCPNCKVKLFDGGLCKKVYCECGKTYERNDEDEIFESEGNRQRDFRDLFREINNVPSVTYIPELVSISFGLFREGAPAEFMIGGRANFPTIFTYYLAPFFTARLRCLGIGEYFSYGETKFKVLGSFPSFGIITESTVIYCSEILTENPINRVQILPTVFSTLSHDISGEITSILKYKHLHTGEYLFINSNEYIVTASQPTDGVIDPRTQFYYEGDPLEPIQTVNMIPYLEDLTFYYQALSRSHLIEEILCDFILPWAQGFRRVISKNQIITIDGIGFLINNCWPERGIIVDETLIIFDGSMARRYSSDPPQIMFSGGNIYVRRTQMSEDPMVVLARHLLSMQQAMGQMGAPELNGAADENIQSLPTHIMQTLPQDPEAAKCMVCLCGYEIGEEVRTLPCFHMFHVRCVDEWLRRSALCPLCKTSIDTN